jgi:hypothetical protein
VKADDLSPVHLAWLVESRAINQRGALKLFRLLEKHPDKMKSSDLSMVAQNLVAVCFSLWRAAFLADKTGTRHAVLQDARTFLGKMLTDNAITYPQDRSAREWTFNYYMNNAKDCLMHLSDRWGVSQLFFPALGGFSMGQRHRSVAGIAIRRRLMKRWKASRTNFAASPDHPRISLN